MCNLFLIFLVHIYTRNLISILYEELWLTAVESSPKKNWIVRFLQQLMGTFCRAKIRKKIREKKVTV